jgi:hypothetical protein
MGPIRSSEMYVNNYHTTLRNTQKIAGLNIVPSSNDGKCQSMANVSPWQVQVHGKCKSMASASPWQVQVHGKCKSMANVSPWQV